MKEHWIKGGHKAKSEIKKSKKSTHCQDRFYISQDSDNDFLCVAIADGAGSAHLSHIGASSVTKGLCKYLQKKFDRFFKATPFLVKRSIIHALRISLEKIAKKKKSAMKNFASTLLFVCIKRNRIIAGHLGDGIILYNKSNDIKILSEPENGEFLNQTYFVTSSHYKHHLRLYKGNIEDITGFYLMTDGISNLFYDNRNKIVSPELIKILSSFHFQSDKSLKESIINYITENIINKSKDDSTLVVLLKIKKGTS